MQTLPMTPPRLAETAPKESDSPERRCVCYYVMYLYIIISTYIHTFIFWVHGCLLIYKYGNGYLILQHMFFADDRINVVRRMILAKTAESRQKALDELLVFQRKDFEGILEAMDGLPVTVRLLGNTLSCTSFLAFILLD